MKPENKQEQKGLFRCPIALLCAIILLLESGCATIKPVPKLLVPPIPDNVALVAAAQDPELKFGGYACGKGEGSAQGAGNTFHSCFGGSNGGCDGNDFGFCLIAMTVWLGVCGVAAAVGGAAGAAVAPSLDDVTSAEASLRSGFEIVANQSALQASVESAARAEDVKLIAVPPADAKQFAGAKDYQALAANGANAALEVSLASVETQGEGINAPVQIVMKARARVVQTTDNKELFSGDFEYPGERLTLAEWAADDATRLRATLKPGIGNLGTQIAESIFLLYPFPDRVNRSASWNHCEFGLAPVGSSIDGSATMPEKTNLDTLHPTLRWQEFPRLADMAAAPEEMSQVSKVRYDLVIAREVNAFPGEVVYRRTSLSQPSHAIETDLPANTSYFWSVRARFDLGGHERVTEWNSTQCAYLVPSTAPSVSSYKFKLP